MFGLEKDFGFVFNGEFWSYKCLKSSTIKLFFNSLFVKNTASQSFAKIFHCGSLGL